MRKQNTGTFPHSLCFVRRRYLFKSAVLTDEDVGDRPHPLLRHHDPDDDEVAARRDRRHRDEEHRPDELPPPRETVRVRFVICITRKRGRKVLVIHFGLCYVSCSL